MPDTQLNIPGFISEQKPSKRGGPPNRMNDLAYKDWMKFQKSFFRYTNDKDIVGEFVRFFTKEVWGDSTASKTLIIGFDVVDKSLKESKRHIRIVVNPRSIKEINEVLDSKSKFDFIQINLSDFLSNQKDLIQFIENEADIFFRLLKKSLNPDKYCSLLIHDDKKFPIAWSIGCFGRKFLKLKDEKIGIHEDEERISYTLIFQNKTDPREGYSLLPNNFVLSKSNIDTPSWIIPKPPPRKKGEIKHPAKFPETLITQFIEDFSSKGDNVLDPMAGTGSTVIAATQMERNGYGIELNQDFVDIARERMKIHNSPSFFRELTDWEIIQEDASNINTLEDFKKIEFQYVITSPPYWSMLNNPGSENQKKRKESNLQLTYSDQDKDLGNIDDYDIFLEKLSEIYLKVSEKMVPGSVLTIIVKNIKRNHVNYTLAWDLSRVLCSKKYGFKFLGNTFWCQDDISLKPFAVGIKWVSNTLHQYCLHFEK